MDNRLSRLRAYPSHRLRLLLRKVRQLHNSGYFASNNSGNSEKRRSRPRRAYFAELFHEDCGANTRVCRRRAA